MKYKIRMNSYKNIKGGELTSFFCIVWLCVFLLNTFGTMTFAGETSATTSLSKNQNSKQTFLTPDFAFPQVVSKNASKQFEKAITSHDGITALEATIQLDISQSLVSANTYKSSIERLDSIALLFGHPYNKLAILLKAQLYADIYSADSWKYNQRKLPLDSLPSNVTEWSGDMFRQKIMGLVENVTNDIESVSNNSLSSIRDLLINPEDAINAKFTIADFISLKAINILNIISNNKQSDVLPISASNNDNCVNPSNLMIKLIDSSIKRNENLNEFVEAYFRRLKLENLNRQDFDNYLNECYCRYKDTEYGAYFVSQYCENLNNNIEVFGDDSDNLKGNLKIQNDLRSERYAILAKYQSRYPNVLGIESVDSQISSLMSKNLNITFPSRMLPDTINNLNITGSNIYDFNIFVYKFDSNDITKSYTYSDLPQATLIKVIPVSINGRSPDRFNNEILIENLSPGLYTFVPSLNSSTSGFIEKNQKSRLSVTLVSNLSVFTSDSWRNTERNLYVVSAINQSPQINANVLLYPILKNGKRGELLKKQTDSDGKIDLPEGDFYYVVKSNNNFHSGNIYKNYNIESPKRDNVSANVFSDLSIYHPNDTVRFSVISYIENDKSYRPAENRELKVILKDANRLSVDSVSVITDKFGRYDAMFKLPGTGLLGQWHITVLDSDGRNIGGTGFEVSEYKAPSFYVELDSSSEEFKLGSTLKFMGRAMTYSGLPVRNSSVSYTLNFEPLWWRRNVSPAQYVASTTTSSDGTFSIEIPTEGLVNREYAQGRYSISVSVTDNSGETRQSSPLLFSFSNPLHILANIPSSVCVDTNSVSFKVTVSDLTGHPIKKTIYYQLVHNGNILKSGQFVSPIFDLDTENIQSGEYKVLFCLNSDFKKTNDTDLIDDTVILWRSKDYEPPIKTPLWVPEKSIVVMSGESKTQIKVGSSYLNSYIFAIISNSHRFVRSEWIKVSDGMATLTVPSPSDSNRLFITLLAERDTKRYSETITVIPYSQTIPLTVEKISFRDQILPDAKEIWKFRFLYDNLKCPSLPVMAVMTDKALNSIEPFEWNFNPYSSNYWGPATRLNYNSVYNLSNYSYITQKSKSKNYKYFEMPNFNTYGFSLYCGNRNPMFMADGIKYKSASQMKIRGTSSTSVNDLLNESMVIEDSQEEVADCIYEAAMVTAGDGMEDNNASVLKPSDIKLRQADKGVAFFMPALITNSEGEVDIEFINPDFIGTWQLQILGYTPDMKGTVFSTDVVSSKKVMAKLNTPRFVRTGDRVVVTATLYNNTMENLELGGRMEFVNPLTNDLIAEKKFSDISVSPSESRIISMEMTIPSNLQVIAVRCYGATSGYSDGEQCIIPVYPESSPINETTPFYINDDSKAFNIKLPEYESSNLNLTLTYCDNAVWECVLALPSPSKSESANIISVADALYGNAMSAGLFAKYPNVLKGLVSMSNKDKDSTLFSPLQKHSDLNQTLLNNTPWVNDATSESIRIRSLVEFADTVKSKNSISESAKVLSDRQNADGGWSWFPGMESSPFMTMKVVSILANLSSSGFLPQEAKLLLHGACRYIDEYFVNEWNRSKRKNISLGQLVNYLYDKGRIPGISSSLSFKSLESETLKKIESDWKIMNIADKATSALVCESHGLKKCSRIILESIRQYSSTSPEYGMWFDNLSPGLNGIEKLLATTRVLRAFMEIEPDNPDINKIRQWIILSKQSQNWGANRVTADIIDAILKSGNINNLASYAPPVIKINGKPLDFIYDNECGEIKINLNPVEASGADLTILKSSGSPSWGGVVAQFVKPISEIKQSNVPQLSITKNIFVETINESGVHTENRQIKVGDKIRVSLTVKSDSDIQYLAINDSRSACLEPLDQISDYACSDGIWMYREIRNSESNIFIPYLTKGTHIISYECYATRAGEYSLGIATAQSQYAPEISAHSAGSIITVE